MLFGHDVVSYFTDGRHQKRLERDKSVYKGVTFRFASARAQGDVRSAQPEKYLPQFGGYCTNGIAYGSRGAGSRQLGDHRRQALHVRRQGLARDASISTQAQHDARQQVLGRGGERLERLRPAHLRLIFAAALQSGQELADECPPPEEIMKALFDRYLGKQSPQLSSAFTSTRDRREVAETYFGAVGDKDGITHYYRTAA
jgi:hypothetical protein